MKRRALAALCLTAALLAGCADTSGGTAAPTAGAGYQAGDGSFTVWKEGERGAPVEITGTDLAGNAVDSSAWRGKPAVVNFWYASCPPCRAEAPDLKALAEEFADVPFLGINPRDDQAAASAFDDTFAIPYPTVLDPQAALVAAMQGKVPLQAMPTTLVLDAQGRVYGRILGRIDPKVLRGLIEDAKAESA